MFTKCIKLTNIFALLRKKCVARPLFKLVRNIHIFWQKKYYPFEIINQSILMSLSCRISSCSPRNESICPSHIKSFRRYHLMQKCSNFYDTCRFEVVYKTISFHFVNQAWISQISLAPVSKSPGVVLCLSCGRIHPFSNLSISRNIISSFL